MQEQNELVDQLTADGSIDREEAMKIIEEHGSEQLQQFMEVMASMKQGGGKNRLGHEGKHNRARAERAKARINHRKNKR